MRLLFGMIGLALLLFLLVFGIFIGAGMLLFAATRRLLASRRPATVANQPGDAIDAEFRVVNKQPTSLNVQ